MIVTDNYLVVSTSLLSKFFIKPAFHQLISIIFIVPIRKEASFAQSHIQPYRSQDYRNCNKKQEENAQMGKPKYDSMQEKRMKYEYCSQH